MNVLLVVRNYQASFPFIQELEENLKKQTNIFVDILDTYHLVLIRHSGERENLISDKLVHPLLSIPKLKNALQVVILRRFFKRKKLSYDVVNAHYFDNTLLFISKQLRNITPRFILMMWGSDFYRTGKIIRERRRRIYQSLDSIVFGNPFFARDFLSYYNDYQGKTFICGFGIRKLDLIKQVSSREDVYIIKNNLGVPKEKIVVTVGYNGTRGQQHGVVLQQLRGLPADKKMKLFLILQMSYGSTRKYTRQVKQKLAATGISGKVINHFLDDLDTCRLRMVTDVVLNAQITDGFSASIQEHIFCGNVLVVGDWLPYEVFKAAGIKYEVAPVHGFADVLSEVLDNYQEWKDKVQDNADKIYAISSWSSKIKVWLSLYHGDTQGFIYDPNVTYTNSI